jgi:DDB1- and CUL4-associated factor 11
MASNAHDTRASSEDDSDYVPPPEDEEDEEENFAQAYLERLLAGDLEEDGEDEDEGEGEDDGGGETMPCTSVPRPS